jgi:hypothetical protein
MFTPRSFAYANPSHLIDVVLRSLAHMPPSYPSLAPSTDYSLHSLHSQVHYGRGRAEHERSGLDEPPNPNLLPAVRYR